MPTTPKAEMTGAIDQGGTFRIGGELEVHRMGFGALRLVDSKGLGPRLPAIDATAVLRRAIELGIDLIDTAECYGPGLNEQQIAAALHPYPAHLVIATKAGLVRGRGQELIPKNDPAHLRFGLEGSLLRLKRDHIDLWQLHRLDEEIPLEEVMGTLATIRAEGKVRHIGLSEVSVEQLDRARRIVPIATVQNRYNLADREHEAVLDYCTAHGIGFMPWYPVAKGDTESLSAVVQGIAAAHGASVQQIALAWLLHRSPVILPIPGTGSIAHLEENVAACAIRLREEDLASIDRARLPASS